jgi:hypothetical protein
VVGAERLQYLVVIRQVSQTLEALVILLVKRLIYTGHGFGLNEIKYEILICEKYSYLGTGALQQQEFDYMKKIYMRKLLMIKRLILGYIDLFML